VFRGAKGEGDQGLSPNTGALGPHDRPQAGLEMGTGGGHHLPLWALWGITRGKFLKAQMLNPAFW